jgi:hypothetical protein
MLAAMLQSAVVGQLRLLSGFGDLVLVLLAAWSLQERVDTGPLWAVLASVLISFLSRLPILATGLGYISIVLIARLLSRGVWRAPLLAMLAVTILGTVIMHLESFAVLRLSGTPLEILDVFRVITLPSLIINIALAVPAFALMRDLAGWVYPAPENA